MDYTVTDFLGEPLKIGDKAVRAGKLGKSPQFYLCEIKEFKDGMVGILTEGRSKLGFTYPDRLIKL